MQTYTHFTVSLAAGIALFPDDYLAQGIFVAGSVLPDMPSAVKMVLDKAHGKKPFADMDKSPLVNNIFHSFFVWAGIVLVCITARDLDTPAPTMTPFFAFALGGLLHCIMDIMTHSGERFSKTDQRILWPFNIATKGFWEYRYDHGILRPKPFELAVNIAAIMATITLVVMGVIFLFKIYFFRYPVGFLVLRFKINPHQHFRQHTHGNKLDTNHYKESAQNRQRSINKIAQPEYF